MRLTSFETQGNVSNQRFFKQWMKFGDRIVVLSDDATVARQSELDTQYLELGLSELSRHSNVKREDLYVVGQKGRLFQKENPGIPVLLDAGRYLLVQIEDEEALQKIASDKPCFSLMKWRDSAVVFESHGIASAARSLFPSWVEGIVDSISSEYYKSSIEHLVGFRTRHSLRPEFVQVAQWAKDQLAGFGFAADLESIDVQGERSFNVVASKAGSNAGGKIVLVVAHLDSVNSLGGIESPAPGADDNASGSAGALTIAKALSELESANELRVILFGGEEQGLFGSKQYVANLSDDERDRILAVINMDMIGTRNTTSPQVLLEGAQISQGTIDGLRESAGAFSQLEVQTSLNPFASDHVPFLEENIPAVLTIEGADSNNQSIHTASDTLEKIDFDFAKSILRMNVGFVASTLGRNLGNRICSNEDSRENQHLSGKYKYSGADNEDANDSSRSLTGSLRFRNESRKLSMQTSMFDPNPVFVADKREFIAARTSVEIVLHIDIDGNDPLDVVSGTFQSGILLPGQSPTHFIGKVVATEDNSTTVLLDVRQFKLELANGDSYDRATVVISRISPVSAKIVFQQGSTDLRLGPFTTRRISEFFREVEIDYDREEGATLVTSYDTHTHPDRPADLPRETLTLQSTFAKSGIGVSLASGSGSVVETDEAGDNERWNNQELHDSMSLHWDSFSNSAQWKMWLFAAKLADSDSLGGIMFDAEINETGGVDRQGTALFTKSPFFHSEEGDYIVANPPTAEAVQRELFFNLIHESGHAFNLAHSFQKELGDPWMPPEWMPIESSSQGLSWMNYPDGASPGLNASWFYNRFRFRFDDNENLFLRHAPERFVQMGNEAWFSNHGRVSRESLDNRLELLIRTRTPILASCQPLVIEIRLRNVSDEPLMVHDELGLADGFLRIAVTDPAGNRTPFIPVSRARCYPKPRMLNKDQRIYASENLTVGKFGFPFKLPGTYKIEAAYHNLDSSTAVSVLQVMVREPSSAEELNVASDLFDARVGRAITFHGTRVMEDVQEKITWAIGKLPKMHPAASVLATTLARPFANDQKLLDSAHHKVRLLKAEPDVIHKMIKPIVSDPESSSNALGHIEYQRMVDKYTACSVAVNKLGDAKKAQRDMLGLFKQRKVVPNVISEVARSVEILEKKSRSTRKKTPKKKAPKKMTKRKTKKSEPPKASRSAKKSN